MEKSDDQRASSSGDSRVQAPRDLPGRDIESAVTGISCDLVLRQTEHSDSNLWLAAQFGI